VPSVNQVLLREEAQTMAEYSVVLALITLAIVTSYALLAGSIQGIFELAVRVFS
jgi:Flp pilus assembly pilin Flp